MLELQPAQSRVFRAFHAWNQWSIAFAQSYDFLGLIAGEELAKSPNSAAIHWIIRRSALLPARSQMSWIHSESIDAQLQQISALRTFKRCEVTREELAATLVAALQLHDQCPKILSFSGTSTRNSHLEISSNAAFNLAVLLDSTVITKGSLLLS